MIAGTIDQDNKFRQSWDLCWVNATIALTCSLLATPYTLTFVRNPRISHVSEAFGLLLWDNEPRQQIASRSRLMLSRCYDTSCLYRMQPTSLHYILCISQTSKHLTRRDSRRNFSDSWDGPLVTIFCVPHTSCLYLVLTILVHLILTILAFGKHQDLRYKGLEGVYTHAGEEQNTNIYSARKGWWFHPNANMLLQY